MIVVMSSSIVRHEDYIDPEDWMMWTCTSFETEVPEVDGIVLALGNSNAMLAASAKAGICALCTEREVESADRTFLADEIGLRVMT